MIQEILINSDPGKFFKPFTWAPTPQRSSDWDELAALLSDGYRLSARKQKSRRRQP
jgi:hypothetical protein